MLEAEKPDARHVSFILIPGFALTSFALTIETLSVVNKLCGYKVYEYHLYSGAEDFTNASVVSSNGVPIQTEQHFTDSPNTNLVILCAYANASAYDNDTLFSRLRACRHKGTKIAALSSASFILARAGLLTDQSCTLFSEDIPTFRELYPRINIQENIYTVNANTFTCAGGMTALDMMLYIVGKDLNGELARQVSHQFSHHKIRSSAEVQNSQRYLELRMKAPCLGAAVEVMEKNLEHPCSIQLLAQKVGTTTRSLELAFKTYENTTPVQYYLRLRLAQARKMIEETRLPIGTIQQATGFSSQSYFIKRFKERYNVAPGQLRNAKKLLDSN